MLRQVLVPKFRQYLQKNGYDTSMMGLEDDKSSVDTSSQVKMEEK